MCRWESYFFLSYRWIIIQNINNSQFFQRQFQSVIFALWDIFTGILSNTCIFKINMHISILNSCPAFIKRFSKNNSKNSVVAYTACKHSTMSTYALSTKVCSPASALRWSNSTTLKSELYICSLVPKNSRVIAWIPVKSMMQTQKLYHDAQMLPHIFPVYL